jgi:TPR repeat protein
MLGLALALVVSASLHGSAWADTVADGLRAYDAGDYAVAARIWGALAEEGNAMAQLGLAGLYRQGIGVPRDLVEAYVWFDLAAAQGRRGAQERRHELAAELTSEQLAEAERRITAFRPR